MLLDEFQEASISPDASIACKYMTCNTPSPGQLCAADEAWHNIIAYMDLVSARKKINFGVNFIPLMVCMYRTQY